MTALMPVRSRGGLDLLRRDPFFTRIFDGFLEDWDEPARSWAPALDLIEEKDRYLVQVEIPGMDPQDVQVELQGDMLTIRGERRADHEEKKEEGRVLRRETVYGSFSRSIRLPSSIVHDEVKATSENGMMTIALPKAQENIGRRIPIQAK